MGTSTGYGGPRNGLVPTWLDDMAPDLAPARQPAVPPTPATGASPPQAPQRAPRPAQPAGGSFRDARSAFSRFSNTGSRSSLSSALSHYVRTGTGGSGGAARRMGASRAAGSRLLGVVRDVQRFGAAEALERHFNLPGFAGRPASDVFVAILDFLCPPGGAIDEAIARQAILDTIAEHAEAGVGNFDTLTPDQLREFFLDFVSRSVEGRVMADLGSRGITLPEGVVAVERAQRQLHDFVVGCTRSELPKHLDGLDRANDAEVDRIVNCIYEAAFELIAVAAEETE